MAKQGMKRPSRTHTKPKNDMPPVPEIQGKAKHGKQKAVTSAYSVFGTDVATDNLTNDLSAADLQDL